jgi:hypothetical protein
MKTVILTLWLLLPVGFGAYHFGPGQERLQLDDAGELLQEAAEHAARAERLAPSDAAGSRADYALALSSLEQALALLPDEETALRQRARLELAKCQLNASQLPQANASLQNLVDELADDPAADPALLAEARRAYASSQYYMTWLERLEGAGREEWEPRIETARQTYKLLSEEADARGDGAAAAQHREDLEAAVRLARLDLSELQGLPLPSQ